MARRSSSRLILERQILEGGLRQVSVHIDTTQAGRRGFPLKHVKCEADLHPVREAFTRLALEMRRRTGLPLRFATTITVTSRNLADVPEVLRWFFATPERAAVWSMLAFLPEADTGRTLMDGEAVTPALVWEKICEGAGLPLRRGAVQFGHAECNSWAPLIVAGSGIRNLPLLPGDEKSTRLFSTLLDAIGGISLAPGGEKTLRYRLAGVFAKRPLLALRLLSGATRLLIKGVWAPGVLARWFTGRAHVTSIYMHNFMSSEQVANAPHDPIVRARLDGCVFKGAIQREGGAWEAVPMCNLTTPTSSDAASNNTIDNLMQHADSLYRFALSRVKDHHVAEALFTLREVDGLDVPAAASVAGVTAGSAAVLLTRSRQKLRTCLQEHGIKP